MATQRRALVTGAGGFIGHHLVTHLKRQGYWVRGADIKRPEYSATDADEFQQVDLRVPELAKRATEGVQDVYALAADMGGMGFISAHNAQILHNNALINLNTLEAARLSGVERLLYTSSACIYPEYLQEEANVTALKEEDAYPAQPQDAYGWEKLITERPENIVEPHDARLEAVVLAVMDAQPLGTWEGGREKLITERLCIHDREDYGLETRIVRFHNIFGPLGTWEGGREKAPAAMCRKVATAKLTGAREIEIWGDGEQTRSFCYIDDCVVGILRLMDSPYHEPLNLGQDRLITINQLADIVADIAGITITRKHIPGPQGVRGRNSDNTRLREVLGWEPQISLEDGLARTYSWIEAQVRAQLAIGTRD
jgi:GDP-D-mannose 3', 5'-epimerase